MSMEDLERVVGDREYSSNDQKYVCFVHKDQYCHEYYDHFARSVKSILLTYRLKFAIVEASGKYRCPLQGLPLVLMKLIAENIGNLDEVAPDLVAEESANTSIKGATNLPYHGLQVISEDNQINQKVLCWMLKVLVLVSMT